MTEQGFLNDLGLENVDSNPNYIPDGKYAGFISKSEIVTSKKDGAKSWVLTYRIAPGQVGRVPLPNGSVAEKPLGGKEQAEWHSLTPKGSPEAIEFKKSMLKKRLETLGIPANRHGSVQPAEFQGLAVSFTIKHKDDYQNIGVVSLRDESAPIAGSNGGVATSSVSAGLSLADDL